MTEFSSFILIGTGGHFTFQVLNSLIQSNCLPEFYIQSGSPAVNPALEFAHIAIEIGGYENPIISLLQQNCIPFAYQSSLDMTPFIRGIQADFILVACWPELLHKDIIDSVRCAALNLHPSLLPAFRGCDPITDQIASGQLPYGVSLHLLSERFDCGEIIDQQKKWNN